MTLWKKEDYGGREKEKKQTKKKWVVVSAPGEERNEEGEPR